MTSPDFKRILCLDFDGVLHKYTSPWAGPEAVLDGPVDGAAQFLQEAVEHFAVAIYSSRSNQPGGIEAMCRWLRDVLLAELGHDKAWRVLKEIQWPQDKPHAFVTIDDRAITFIGTWPSMASLKTFKPWNKR